MAGDQPARGGVLETMEDFYRRRQAEIANLGLQAEAAAHKAYGEAIRAAQNLALRTQAEVNRYGADLLSRRKRTTAASHPMNSAMAPRPEDRRGPMANTAPKSITQQAVDQTLAAARGAQDALTLGLGDKAYAGTRALVDAANGADLGAAWRSRMAAERARDDYDARNYRAARTVGEIGGTALGLAALGPVDAMLAGGVRIAQAAPMVAREAAVLGGVGAGGGVLSQGVTDLQRRHLGSVGDYAGSAVGGAATALASARGRPGQAGAIGGATTSIVQDALNGRSIDWSGAGQAALAGGYAAAPFGYAGRRYSDGLPMADKGKLGEAMGRVRTMANGREPIAGGERVRLDGSGKITVLDEGSSVGQMSEQKFGRSIRNLRPNQREAYNQFGDRYRVDHFLPRDVGAFVAYPFGQIGYHEVLADDPY